MLIELLYCSVSVAPKLTDEDLNHILASARRRNLAEDITGMLIYHRGEFVQILEGENKSVANVYEKFIGSDLRHTAINKVQENTISHRSSRMVYGFCRYPRNRITYAILSHGNFDEHAHGRSQVKAAFLRSECVCFNL